jgi:hypothetical protein
MAIQSSWGGKDQRKMLAIVDELYDKVNVGRQRSIKRLYDS